MKKIIPWIIVISFMVLVVAWGVMTVKLFNDNYDFQVEAYLGYCALVIFCVFVIIKKFSSAKFSRGKEI